ncbi:glycoside hydrolase family 16 protein [Nocardioides sp. P5_C9_2]
MSGRRALAGSLLALLMPASMILVTQTSSSSADTNDSVSTSVSERRAKKTRVSLVALPQIVAQGKRPASANSAKAGLTATVKPGKPGRTVALQVQSGSKWKTVKKAKTTKKGLANFAAPISKGGVALTYRATAMAFKGSKAGKSKSVSTGRWLTPTWTDEFSGSTLNPVWNQRGSGYEPESLRACSKGDARAVKVTGGTARLSVMKDPARSDKCVAKKDGKSTGKFAYRLNGHIGTQGGFSFKYGFAAARIKFQKSRGQHGAFWMQPASSVVGANDPRLTGAEIDVIEYFGDKHPEGGLTSFVYSKNGKGQGVKTGSWIKDSKSFLSSKGDGWSKNYHVFSVEWTPNVYIFRIDGQETYRTKVGVSGQPQYPILSMLASDYEISKIGKDSKLPQSMSVDWIRVWQA